MISNNPIEPTHVVVGTVAMAHAWATQNHISHSSVVATTQEPDVLRGRGIAQLEYLEGIDPERYLRGWDEHVLEHNRIVAPSQTRRPSQIRLVDRRPERRTLDGRHL